MDDGRQHLGWIFTGGRDPRGITVARAGAVPAWLWRGLALIFLLAIAGVGVARAQGIPGSHAPVAKDQPVFYQADQAEYDRDAGLVTLSGHVEIWQNDRVLRADKVTYDRNTDVAAATGNVILMEPDGQVLFSDYAELTQGLKDGVMRGMRAMLTQNGKLAANGARRTNAEVNELSRAVYTTCDCPRDPDSSPLWQIRARSAVQDLDNKRIEYRDAVVDIYGIPVLYTPYLTHPDPSQKRASGFLVPTIGNTSHLGAFVATPYFWAIDDQQDATLTPIIASKSGPALDTQYRRAFNNGTVTVNASVANDNGLQGTLFGKGQFAIDDEWRWGFDINRASSGTYLSDFRLAPNTATILPSQVYLEGFGQGSYSRLDARVYQGVTNTIDTAKLPYILPHYEYSFIGQPDALGGRTEVTAGAFNVLRNEGTNTQRTSVTVNWERPAIGKFGDIWKLVLHADAAAYAAHRLDEEPNFSTNATGGAVQGLPVAALQLRWPLQRDAGRWGTQVLEPILQVIAAPNAPSYVNTRVPNEDSLDFQFTDANLFSLNRYPGIDRLEGGERADVGLHAAWWFPNGSQVDALAGQSYRTKNGASFPIGSGLEDSVSDVVTRVAVNPTPNADLSTHERFDHHNFALRYADALGSFGPTLLRITGGYLYTNNLPFYYYDNPPPPAVPGPPRNEITLGGSTAFGHWRFDAYGRRDLQSQQMVGVSAGGAYEDECFIFDAHFYRRYTSINNDHGDTAVLLQITLKTVGQFGFHPL